jgi:hypothetical protein
MKNPARTGKMIAIAAGSLFAVACSKGSEPKTMPAAEKTASGVHCMGINACKGQGSCHSAKNACNGQNGCKGEGRVDVASADECTSKGGTVMAEK